MIEKMQAELGLPTIMITDADYAALDTPGQSAMTGMIMMASAVRLRSSGHREAAKLDALIGIGMSLAAYTTKKLIDA